MNSLSRARLQLVIALIVFDIGCAAAILFDVDFGVGFLLAVPTMLLAVLGMWIVDKRRQAIFYSNLPQRWRLTEPMKLAEKRRAEFAPWIDMTRLKVQPRTLIPGPPLQVF